MLMTGTSGVAGWGQSFSSSSAGVVSSWSAVGGCSPSAGLSRTRSGGRRTIGHPRTNRSGCRREFESYLDCGLLCRGFALIACEDCDERRLVAFSCHGRGFCPSCLGRRMAQTALNLVDHVLPPVGLRQFVLTLPFELRARLAYDGKLLGAVTRVFSDSVLGFYRRRLRAVDGVSGCRCRKPIRARITLPSVHSGGGARRPRAGR